MSSAFALFDVRDGSCQYWEFDLESVHLSEAAALQKARQMGYAYAAYDRANCEGIREALVNNDQRFNSKNNSQVLSDLKGVCVIEELRLDPVYDGAMEWHKPRPVNERLLDFTKD